MVAGSAGVQRAIESGVDAAASYFTAMVDRMQTRALRGIVGVSSAAIDGETRLGELVREALKAPLIRMDSIGVYVLSEQPICPR
jgi:D-aminopeptidase